MTKSVLEEIQECLEQLKDRDAAVRAGARWKVCRLLGSSSGGERRRLPRDILPPKKDPHIWVEDQPKPEGKLMAIRILGSADGSWQDEAVQALLDIAASQRAQVDQRAWALYSLTFLDHQFAGNSLELDRLLRILEDPQGKVRQWAAFALGKLASAGSASSEMARLADRPAHNDVERALHEQWQREIDTGVCRALVIAMGKAGGYVTPSDGKPGPAAEMLRAAIDYRYAEVLDELPAAVSGVARNVTELADAPQQDRVTILDALIDALKSWLSVQMGNYDAYRATIATLVDLVRRLMVLPKPTGEGLAVKGLNLLLDLAESPDYPIDDDELRESVQERSIRALERIKPKSPDMSEQDLRLQALLDQVAVPQLKLMLCRRSEAVADQARDTLTKLLGPVAAAEFYASAILDDGPATAAAKHYLEYLDKLTVGTVLRDEVFRKVRGGEMTRIDALARLEERVRQRAARSLGGIGEGAQSDAFDRLNEALQRQAGPGYERARAALSSMGGAAAATALVAAARRTWVESKFFGPIEDADQHGKSILNGTVWMSRISWGFTLLVSLAVAVVGVWLLSNAIGMINRADVDKMEALAAGLGGLIAVVVGLLTPFFWNSAAAVQKGSAEMTRLVTGFHGYMGRMRLLGLGFADLFTREKADAALLTAVSDAAGDAMLDSAGVLTDVGAWPAGKGTVKVPDVAGKSWADAEALAAERGLAVTLKELAYSDTESGKVSAQSPAASSAVETGTTIELTLSKGKEPEGEAKAVETPSLAGKSWADAEEAAKGKGLAITYAGSRPDAAAKDTVIEQQPPAGTQVVAGSTVKLTLSDGPQVAAGQEVPDLAGKTADQAQDAVAAAKLKLTFADFAYDPAVDKGKVLSQDIPAKTMVAEGTTVSVTVSMGKQP